MKYGLILSLLVAIPCMGQTQTTGEAKSSGPCSPAVSGNNNRIIIEDCQSRSKKKVESPAFHERAGNATIEIGGNAFQFDVEHFRRLGEIQPISVSGYSPVTLKLKGDTLLFSVKLWSATGDPPVEIENNEFKVNRPGWDWNYTADAFEVVNETMVPVFQIIRKSSLRLAMNGIFYGPRGMIVASDEGFSLRLTLGRYVQKPIFKYPAWRFPGKYADGSN